MLIAEKDPAVRVTTVTSDQRRKSPLLSSGLFGLAWAFWAFGIANTNLAHAQGSWGLVPALPWFYYLGLALMIASFAGQLMRSEVSGTWLGVHIVSIVFMMQAPMPLLYAEPRYFWDFKAVGEINYMAQAGHLQLNTDIYQRFPGFYGFAAWFDRVAGIQSPLSYMKWFPVAAGMLLVWSFWFTARVLPITKRALWLAVGFFVVSEWYLLSSQTNLTPQAPAFFLALVILGLLLRQRKPALPPSTKARGVVARAKQWWSWLGRDPGYINERTGLELDRRRARTRQRAYRLEITLATVLFVAIVTGHPLTPIVVILECGVLLLLGRLRPAWLVFLFVGIFGLYLLPNFGFLSQSIGAFKGLGDVSGNVGTPHPGLNQVGPDKYFLPVLIVLMGLLAGIGAIRTRREWRTPLRLLVLSATPVIIVGLVHYGQETVYRAFMFADVWLACLAALAILGPSALQSADRQDRPGTRVAESMGSRPKVVVGVIFALVLVLAALTTIGSDSQNEIYQVSSGDIGAALWLSEHTKPGPIIYLDKNFPVSIGANYADYLVGSTRGFSPQLINRAGLMNAPLSAAVPMVTDYSCHIQKRRPSYLVLSRSQYRFADLFGYVRTGSYDSLLSAFRSSGDWHQIYANSDSVIFVNVSPCGDLRLTVSERATMRMNREHVIDAVYQPVTRTWLYLTDLGGVYTAGGHGFFGSWQSVPRVLVLGKPLKIRANPDGGYAILNQFGQLYTFGPGNTGSGRPLFVFPDPTLAQLEDILHNREHLIDLAYQPVTRTFLFLSNVGRVYPVGGNGYFGDVSSIGRRAFVGVPAKISPNANGGYTISNQVGQTYTFGPPGTGTDYAGVVRGRGLPT